MAPSNGFFYRHDIRQCERKVLDHSYIILSKRVPPFQTSENNSWEKFNFKRKQEIMSLFSTWDS